jgi:hypothetical protein
MLVPLGIWRARGVAVALASGTAILLTAISAGMNPALAEPLTETTVPTVVEVVPTEEVVTDEVPTILEVPTQVPPTVAPQLPLEPTTQAPIVTQETQASVVTQETQAPVVTQEPQIVTTTAAPQVTAEPEPVTTTEAEPVPTPTAQLTTTDAAPIPTPTASATTTAATTPGTTSTPVTTGATTGTSTSPDPSVGLVPSTTTPSSSTSQTTAEGSTSSQPTTGDSTTGTGGTNEPDTTAGGGSPEPPSSEPAGGTEEAAGVTKLAEPQRLEAAPQDVELAQQAVPVQENPPPAPQAEIDRIRDLVIPPANPGANSATSATADAGLVAAERRVLQWQPDWVQYDMYYRPLIFNPYPEPLQVVYQIAGLPRILLIPPLGRIVTEVRELGSYNFTVLRLNAFGIPIDIAVGNFFGGGYLPGPGLPPPPPPPPVRTLTDVPVQVKYTNATYEPIRVQKIVDVGPDPAVGGEHKVLLDGVTPAWGEWKQTDTGVQQFEVHKTQSFPGMEAPAEGPLPGDYDMQLVSDESPTGLSGKDITLIIAAAIVATLGLGAIVLTIFLGRRRRPQH